VSAALDPLIPTTAASNTLTIARSGTPFVSGYRTALDDSVSLAPAGGRFQATPCLGTRAYFAPAGAFTLAAAAPAGARDLLGGLSAVERLRFADGNVVTFAAGHSAGIAATIVTEMVDGELVTYTTFAPAAPPDDTASQVSWAAITPAAARDYVCEGELAPMFAGPQPPTDPAAVLAFKPFALRRLAASAASPVMPLLPYAGFDVGNAGSNAATAAAFEYRYVAPTRLKQLETLPPATTPGDTVWALTPQGYVARFVDGVLTGITLGSVTGGDSSASLSFGGDTHPLPQELANPFLANQQFIVATCLRSDQQPYYSATATLSGWAFNVSLPDPATVVPGAYQTVLVIKSASGSVKQFAAEPYAWTAYSTFNNAANDTDGQILSNWLTAYLDQAEALYANDTGLTSLATFVELINNPDWNGYIYLHVPITPGALDPSIQFLVAGIDTSQFFAHHVGCALNHTTVGTNPKSPYDASSSYLGLVHYLRPGVDPNSLTGTPPYVPQSVDYDFQVMTLDARFENSALIDFKSSAQLVMTKLFGDAILPTSSDLQVLATDALMIYGAMQMADDVPHYVFATAKGASSTFFPSSAAFERIEIDRALVSVGMTADASGFRTATFQMSGWFGLLPADAFDVLSFAAMSFDQLALDMRFKTGEPSTYALRTGGVTLTQMPSRAAEDDEEITAAKAAANVIYRAKSLAAGFPLQGARLMTVTDDKQTPASLGYRALSTQVSLGSAPSKSPWYALALDLPLGGGGSLSSGTLFTAKLLFAWAPGGTGKVAIGPFFMLQGPGGVNLTLEIEGVLKLGAAGIYLMQNKAGQFVLELASLGITILSQSFPPAGTTNLLLAGVEDPDTKERFLGWFGAYVQASK
jgi:hypothetical protein